MPDLALQMTIRGAFRVDEVPGPRWNIAMDSLRHRGLSSYIEGSVVVGLSREDQSPNPDRRVHVRIFTAFGAPIVGTAAQREVDAGMEIYRAVIAADPQFSSLVAEFGVVFEYLHDYGMGAAMIGSVSEDGVLTLV